MTWPAVAVARSKVTYATFSRPINYSSGGATLRAATLWTPRDGLDVI